MEPVEQPEQRSSIRRESWSVYLLMAVLAAATIISTAYLFRERHQGQELAAANHALNATLVQLQNRVQDLTQQVDLVKSTQDTPVRVAPPQTAKPRAAKATKAVAPSRRTQPRDDPRFKELQGQLSDQQEQLASTREALDKTRDDLSGALNNTRDELSGSIAKTHDELVALQKRGERNYYEFDLTKSKQFERVGPLRLSLRKADAKHKRFDMNMLVDDNQLQKKGVNLYETIWINTGDRPQPMELVVNQITKDHIQGYLSEPKYKKSELSQTADAAARP
jgi:septal ring factor EnvC (AmiA/AmiB activator)